MLAGDRCGVLEDRGGDRGCSAGSEHQSSALQGLPGSGAEFRAGALAKERVGGLTVEHPRRAAWGRRGGLGFTAGIFAHAVNGPEQAEIDSGFRQGLPKGAGAAPSEPPRTACGEVVCETLPGAAEVAVRFDAFGAS